MVSVEDCFMLVRTHDRMENKKYVHHSVELPRPSKSTMNVAISSRGMEQDFRCLSQRYGSTSTPFNPRVAVCSPCELPLEDSAVCMLGSFDRTPQTGNTPASQWSEERDGQKSSPLPQHLKSSCGLRHHSLSYESLCLATERGRSMPCLHCSRAKSHSDSELFELCKHVASESHAFDYFNLTYEQCDKNGTNHPELPSMSSMSKTDLENSSHDTGYHSTFSKESESFEKCSKMTVSPSSLLQAPSAKLVTDSIPSQHPPSSNGLSLRGIMKSSVKTSRNICKHVLPAELFASQLLDKCAPAEPDRLIGRKMGLATVDFISELQNRDLYHPISLILRSLSSKDLLSASKVNERWKHAIQLDQSAGKFLLRLRKRQLTQKLQKENNGKKRTSSSHSKVTGSHGPLTEVQQSTASYSETKSSQTQLVNELSKKYWKEAEQLKNEEALRKCPKCSSPARTQPVQDRACCTKPECKYDFCIRCRQPFHGSKDCAITATPKKKQPSPKVGGRKSKKNLRRL